MPAGWIRRLWGPPSQIEYYSHHGSTSGRQIPSTSHALRLPIDEGYIRAAQADKDVAAGVEYSGSLNAQLGALHSRSSSGELLFPDGFGGQGGDRPQGSASAGAPGAACYPEQLKADYRGLKDAIDEAQDILINAPGSRCPSCGWRWLQLQRADDLLSFLGRTDVSALEGGRPRQPSQYAIQTGRACKSLCPKHMGPAMCKEGMCYCPPGHVFWGGRCNPLPEEVNGEDLGDLTNMDGSEVSKLGQALAAAQLAGAGARGKQVEVPGEVSEAIAKTQALAHQVAAQGFRCRASTFLEFL
eukprot:TRINITY_DN47598_c0_g1_i1.p1 TRINITY_DN47598_c0_g1~~TRINITY_DN47598_c0_g1_i1.p1  ORF type:complete len:299 (-),score=45.49 TRINITY_DN47598_c0_g1_i1:128-1024(-)